MKYLIDTHVLIWYFANSRQLPGYIYEILRYKKNISVSIASLWEIAIKINIGRLKIDGYEHNDSLCIDDFINLCKAEGFSVLDITQEHLKKVIEIPLIHRDPFDRLYLAQSLVENMILLTEDSELVKYPYDNIIS